MKRLLNIQVLLLALLAPLAAATPASATTWKFDDFTRNVTESASASWGTTSYPTTSSSWSELHTTNGSFYSVTSLAAPTSLAATPSDSGGSLATGTYYYKVTAFNAHGETSVSLEADAAVTGPNGSVALTWNAVSGATSYRIYRGTSRGGQDTYYTSAGASFTDTGGAGTAGSAPMANTTGVAKIKMAPSRQRGQKIDSGQTALEATSSFDINDALTGVGGNVQVMLYAGADSGFASGYMVTVRFNASGTADCALQKRSGGSTSTLDGFDAISSYSGGDEINVKLRVGNDTQSAECWEDGETPVSESATDAAITESTYIGARAVSNVLLMNTEFGVFVDDVHVYSIGHTDPKVAAVGDISCRGGDSAFNSGNGFDYIATSDATHAKDASTNLTACHQRWTSDLVCGTTVSACDSTYSAIVGLGDFQYPCAMPDEYTNTTKAWSYQAGGGYNSWRRVTDSGKWYPVVGNHEYEDATTTNCSLTTWVEPTDYDPGECYYQVFNGTRSGGTTGNGETAPCDPATTGIANPDGNTGVRSDGETVIGGYYTFDVGTWRFIVLNSGDDCTTEGPLCDDGTGANWGTWGNDQADYLDYQLDNNTQPCVAVAFHEPRWSSDGDDTGGGSGLATWWDTMYKGVGENEADHKVDVVLNGHDHFYERFDKMNESGASASDGIREFISGAGGKSIFAIDGTTSGVSEAKNPVAADSLWDLDTDPDDYPNKTAGALELVLKPNGYQYRFRPSPSNVGGFPDNGTYTDPSGGGLSGELSCNADGV